MAHVPPVQRDYQFKQGPHYCISFRTWDSEPFTDIWMDKGYSYALHLLQLPIAAEHLYLADSCAAEINRHDQGKKATHTHLEWL